MHSNKKILTSKNSPWLLCPSKSFPGKFYYFNGSTGETAWSLNDVDNKYLKKSTICTVTDKTHTYPEPVGPPAEDSNTSSSIRKEPSFTEEFPTSTLRNHSFGNILNIKKTFNTRQSRGTETDFSHQSTASVNYGHTNSAQGLHFYENVQHNSAAPSRMFGQAVFPKYIPEASVPKVIWALTPMLVPEQPTQKRMLDQITQYETQELFTSVPLTHRFKNLQNPFQFTSTPFRKEVPMLAQRCNGTQTFDPKPETKDEGCQTLGKNRMRTRLLSESTPKTILKPSQSLGNLNVEENNKSSSPNTEVDDSSNADRLSALKENDLRFLLVAKRRQSVTLSDTPKSTKEPKTQKTPLVDVAPKKRVTFALDEQNASTDESQSNGALSPDSLEIECTEPSVNISGAGHIWYIAADLIVLLTGFECVEQFVLSDKKCRLLIPYVVKMKIESLSKGECVGRQHTVTARQISRKLATPNTHIVVQRKPDTVSACEENAILKCCWQLFQESQVVLLTNNTKLYDKAKIIDIECHTFEEFKSATKRTEKRDPFDWKKVQITVNNDDKPTRNIFQQTLEQLNNGLTQSLDYPARTLFDNQKMESDKFVFGKNNKNDKLINLTNTNKALKHVIHNVDEIDQDISRLEITERMMIKQNRNNIIDTDDDGNKNERQNQSNHNQFKNNRDKIKISGITKLDCVFDLEDELKRFYIKSDLMENRIKSRRDEWICRLSQIMEDTLTNLLLNEKAKFKKIPPPWNLSEAILVVGEKYKNQSKIKAIAEKFNAHLVCNCSNNGKLNQNIKPVDIIKMVGFSMILIQNLKKTIDGLELNEADDRLSELIKNIEDPKTDVEFNLESVITPVLRRSDERETRTPMSYLHKQAEVLDYLKRHFKAMEDYELEKQLKVVRTTGKDLNTLKISNNKEVTVEIAEVRERIKPKVIRNADVIDEYEKFFKIEVDRLVYEDTLVTISSEHDDLVENEMVFIPNEDTLKVTDISECSVIEETLGSSFYNECLLACPLLKSFLAELRSTFMQIFTFISETMQDYHDRELYEDKRSDISVKTNMAHKYILKIIDRLQSIVARESGNGPTVKDLLIQAGDYVDEDKTMAQYKDVVAGYLEQAVILEDALNTLIALSPYNSEIDSISYRLK